MSAKLKKGDCFLSKRKDWAGKPRLVTVVVADPVGPPGSALVDSENQSDHVVRRCYVRRERLLDPRHYTRREVKP